MLKWLSSQVFWGIMLIVGGVLFLLQNLNVFQGGELFWGVAMGIVGVLFLMPDVLLLSRGLLADVPAMSVATLALAALNQARRAERELAGAERPGLRPVQSAGGANSGP